MSAIASFIKLSKEQLGGLKDAAVPKKRFFGGVKDNYHDFLSRHGRPVADYKWSGSVLATLLVYLQQEQQINLMKSEFDQLSKFLCDTRSVTIFIFTHEQKRSFIDKLGGGFSEQAMGDYFNKFNATNEADAGKPMMDGIQAFRQSLNALDEKSVILFSIG